MHVKLKMKGNILSFFAVNFAKQMTFHKIDKTWSMAFHPLFKTTKPFRIGMSVLT